MQRPQGLQMCVRKGRKLRVCLLDQLLWRLEPNLANANILLHKRRIKGLRAAPEINEGPLHFQNHSGQKRHFTLCFEKDLLKSWQQKHNELNAQWDGVWVAKCLHQFLWQKQSLISRQLPSNDSPRTGSSLFHPSPQQGPKGDSPKEWRSEQFAFTLKPPRLSNPTVTPSPFHCITTVIQMIYKKSSEYSFLQKREEIRRVKRLITMFQKEVKYLFYDPSEGTCPHLLQSSTSNSFFNNTGDEHACNCPHTPRLLNQSINPAGVRDISYTKVDFSVPQMRLKNKCTLQQHSMRPFVLSQKTLWCVRLRWQAGALKIRQLAAQLTLKSRNNKAVYQIKTWNIAHGSRLSRDVTLRIKQQVNTVKGQWDTHPFSCVVTEAYIQENAHMRDHMKFLTELNHSSLRHYKGFYKWHDSQLHSHHSWTGVASTEQTVDDTIMVCWLE